MTLIAPDFTFSCQQLSHLNLDAFSDHFQHLSPDKQAENAHRSRRYSQFTGPATALTELPHNAFIQSSNINYLAGDIPRDFSPLEPSLIELPQFGQLIQTVNDFFGFNPDKTTLGVHQIRITCSGHKKGLPAPEGIHQDGFDLIVICCIARHNVAGAQTELYPHPDKKAVYKGTMQPGDIIYCNDRKLYHYTSPIEVEDAQSTGYRDMFVITVSLSDQPCQ